MPSSIVRSLPTSRSYLPPFRERASQLWKAIVHILSPPAIDADWVDSSVDEGVVLVVLDAIVAYESMFTKRTFRAIQRLLDRAEQCDVPIVFTQWNRFLPEATATPTAVDRKGYWTWYIPQGQNDLLRSHLRIPQKAKTVFVKHPNMLHEHPDLLPPKCRVVLCGCWTESCVVGTARSALDHDHAVTVVADACVGHEPNATMAMLAIQLAYGSVVASE